MHTNTLEKVCGNCRAMIHHSHGRLWSDGSLVFPQYCKTRDGGEPLKPHDSKLLIQVTPFTRGGHGKTLYVLAPSLRVVQERYPKDYFVECLHVPSEFMDTRIPDVVIE